MSVPRLPIPGAISDPARPPKIAIEEAFAVPEALEHDDNGNVDHARHAAENGLDLAWWKTVYERIIEFDSTRIQAMDDSGIGYIINSFCCPGIEGICDAAQAQDTARRVNDFLAEKIAAHPDRFGGFGSVALHDPDIAVAEIYRCINELGFQGVLFNGYAQHDTEDNLVYLDHPKLTPIWQAVADLDVPVYIHPRVSYRQRMYDGHVELEGATWGFAPETATHVLRLVYAGVFDRFPTAQVIVGHMGEMLPFMAWRIDHCFQFNPGDKRPQRHLQDYLRDNIWATTSGNFNSQALQCAIATMGADRLMFSVDYPFENMDEAAAWFDTCPISEDDRDKIGHSNARLLFGLD